MRRSQGKALEEIVRGATGLAIWMGV